jgi:hypothetical protein
LLDLAAKGKEAWNAWRRVPANKRVYVTFRERRGSRKLRKNVEALAPFLAGRTGELNDIKLLSVAVDRLAKWHNLGLLCTPSMRCPGWRGSINLTTQNAIAAAKNGVTMRFSCDQYETGIM